MKMIAFVSRRKIVAQGLEAALSARPELEMKMFPLIPPPNAQTDMCVYRPDLALIDVTKEMGQDNLFHLCRDLRKSNPECRLILLLSEVEVPSESLSVEARRRGLVDDFVFYDSSMDYLLAKLTAL